MNETTTSKVISTDEKIAAFLDMRLLLKYSFIDLTGWKDSKQLLRNYYVEFYLTATAYNRKDSNVKNEACIVIDDETTYNDGMSVEDNISVNEVCIDSDTEEEFIESSSITEDKMKENDENIGHIEFKTVSKKWTNYSATRITTDKWR